MKVSELRNLLDMCAEDDEVIIQVLDRSAWNSEGRFREVKLLESQAEGYENQAMRVELLIELPADLMSNQMLIGSIERCWQEINEANHALEYAQREREVLTVLIEELKIRNNA